jgi:electron transport complex protein RnfG
MILVLTLITVLSGGILAGWDMYTKPKVAYHRLQALKAAIGHVLPDHGMYESQETETGTLYFGKTDSLAESPVGVAFMAIGSGFQGEVRIMVGLTPDLMKLTGIKVLEQIETPGLGTKIVVDPSNKQDPFWFPKQFEGIVVSPEIVVLKNAKPSANNEVQGITGATISSKAIARIINDKIKAVQKTLSSTEGRES